MPSSAGKREKVGQVRRMRLCSIPSIADNECSTFAAQTRLDGLAALAWASTPSLALTPTQISPQQR